MIRELKRRKRKVSGGSKLPVSETRNQRRREQEKQKEHRHFLLW
jgi:hypothetical protein